MSYLGAYLGEEIKKLGFGYPANQISKEYQL